MKASSFFNIVSAGLFGGIIASYTPGFIEDCKKSFNEAYMAQLNKPWSQAVPSDDGPGTYTLYQAPGVISFGVYRNTSGKIDRVGKPAVTVFAGDGHTIIGRVWFKNGELHREDGPAVVSLDAYTGKIVCEEWYFNGEKTQPWERVSLNSDQQQLRSRCLVPTTPFPTLSPL